MLVIKIFVLYLNMFNTKTKIMTTQEINNGLIGNKVEIIVTGLMVKGIITGIVEDQFRKGIEVNHEPVQWGQEIFTNTTSTARKFDQFGSLKHAKLI